MSTTEEIYLTVKRIEKMLDGRTLQKPAGLRAGYYVETPSMSDHTYRIRAIDQDNGLYISVLDWYGRVAWSQLIPWTT